jgi:putative addiction module component (TIGR02574 family)
MVKRQGLGGRLKGMTREALLEEVRKLPRTERADVAAELLASLDEEPADNLEEVQKAWAKEIERRARRVLAGESAGVPWGQVKRRIEGRLAK